jgi:GT2 family glycosyltransferase
MLKQKHEPKEIICVDNGSTADSARMIKNAFPGVTLLTSEKNIGFGGGMNLGIRIAIEVGCDYVLCINNDAFTDDPDFIDKLVDAFNANPRTGIAGGVEMDESGTTVRYSGYSGDSKYQLKASGAAFVISRRAIEAAGLYDDRFFLGYEDHDLFIRVEKKGFEVVTVEEAAFRHSRAAARSQYIPLFVYLEARNRTIMFARFWGFSGFLDGVMKMHLKRLPRYVLAFSEQKRPDLLRAYLRGLLDGAILLPKVRQPGAIPPVDPSDWMHGQGPKEKTEYPTELRFG